MAKIYYDDSADPALIQSKKVAVFGYGSQGHAHALNLRDSGVSVRVALPEGSRSRAKAQADGVTVTSGADAAAWADVMILLAPDTKQPALFREAIAPHLTAGKMLMFAHGFNIRYKTIEPPKNVDVTLIAPKAPGHRVREVYVEGGGTPGLLAVEQDATGQAKALALSYARALGLTRAGSSRRRLPKRPRPTFLASRRYCVVASARSSRPHSRHSSRRGTSLRSRTSSACTSSS